MQPFYTAFANILPLTSFRKRGIPRLKFVEGVRRAKRHEFNFLVFQIARLRNDDQPRASQRLFGWFNRLRVGFGNEDRDEAVRQQISLCKAGARRLRPPIACHNASSSRWNRRGWSGLISENRTRVARRRAIPHDGIQWVQSCPVLPRRPIYSRPNSEHPPTGALAAGASVIGSVGSTEGSPEVLCTMLISQFYRETSVNANMRKTRKTRQLARRWQWPLKTPAPP